MMHITHFVVILHLIVSNFSSCSIIKSIKLTREDAPHGDNQPHLPTDVTTPPLEPVLLPPGTFIAQSFLDPNATEADQTNDIAALLAEALGQALHDGHEMRRKRQATEPSTTSTATTPPPPPPVDAGNVLALYGIKPLTAVTTPMGIFIADAQPTSPTRQRTDLRRRMFAKFQKIFSSLKVYRKADGHKLFRFGEVFETLTPLKAVYIPKGHLIPLSKIPGTTGSTALPPSLHPFAGITPLTILRIPAGVFIPHPVSSLPDIPPNVLPPLATTVASTAASQTTPTSATIVTSATVNDGPTVPPPAPTTPMPREEPTASTSPVTTLLPLPPEEVEKAFKQWVDTEYTPSAEAALSQYHQAKWNFETNLSDQTKAALVNSTMSVAKFQKAVTGALLRFPVDSVKDPMLNRLHRKLSKSGDSLLDSVKYRQLQIFKADMTKTYATAKVCADTCVAADNLDGCPKENQLSLHLDLSNTMAASRNSTVLSHLWKSWRDATGKTNRNSFIRYVQLKSEAAKLDGYKSVGASWRETFADVENNYTDKNFLEDIRDLLKEVFPLYQQLHAYVRRKLINKYPESRMKANGPIPAHLLGHIHGFDWSALNDFAKPYPQKLPTDELNIDAQFTGKQWSTEKMYKTAEKFYTDLGLEPLPESLWKDSVFVKSTDKEMVCDYSSFDFHDKSTFRVKACANTTLKDLVAIHREMGRLHYALAYRNQHVPFRSGAHTGLFEAVGASISLNARTPKHLVKIGLLSEEQAGRLSDPLGLLNFLFSTALDTIAYLPFAYVVDKYRYDVFDGRITMNDLNTKWWSNVIKFQGLCSTEPRTEDDFDPGALYEINSDTPYIRNFVSTILQFQIQKALCGIAGQTKNPYECDIDGSKEAGKILQETMSLGSSTPWQTVMQKLTGTVKLDAAPLLDYFQRLHEWLERDNTQHNVFVGWEENIICGK